MRKAPKVFAVIDPALRVVTGHQYEYTKLVLEAAAGRGYEVRAFGCVDTAETIRREPWFVPIFSPPGVYKADLTSPRRLAMVGFRWVARELRWYRELRRLLDHTAFQPGDKVLVHTIHNPSIWQWRLVQDWFEKHGVDLFLFFRVARRTVPRGLRRFFDVCYRGIGVGRSHIHFLTDTQGLCDEYQSLSSVPLAIVGLPVDPLLYQERTDLQPSGTPTVEYIGCARHDKGFHLLPEMIRLLNDRPGGFKGAFVVQCTPPQGGLDAACQAALNELRQLRGTWGNLELIEEDLPLPAYRRMLRNSSILVFPYESDRYRTATSNILGQALALGKASVVTAHTWLAEAVTEAGFGEISERSPAAFAAGIERSMAQIQRGAGMPSHKLAEWRTRHSPLGIVSEIERLANGTRPPVRIAPTRAELFTTATTNKGL